MIRNEQGIAWRGIRILLQPALPTRNKGVGLQSKLLHHDSHLLLSEPFANLDVL
jgi:hypothetical protein